MRSGRAHVVRLATPIVPDIGIQYPGEGGSLSSSVAQQLAEIGHAPMFLDEHLEADTPRFFNSLHCIYWATRVGK